MKISLETYVPSEHEKNLLIKLGFKIETADIPALEVPSLFFQTIQPAHTRYYLTPPPMVQRRPGERAFGIVRITEKPYDHDPRREDINIFYDDVLIVSIIHKPKMLGFDSVADCTIFSSDMEQLVRNNADRETPVLENHAPQNNCGIQ